MSSDEIMGSIRSALEEKDRTIQRLTQALQDAQSARGLWVKFGDIQAAQHLSDPEFERLRQLVEAGSDFKIGLKNIGGRPFALWPVIRVILPRAEECWMYMDRERADGGKFTAGISIGKNGSPNATGYCWIGTPRAVGSVDDLFTGTSGAIGTSNVSFTLFYRS